MVAGTNSGLGDVNTPLVSAGNGSLWSDLESRASQTTYESLSFAPLWDWLTNSSNANQVLSGVTKVVPGVPTIDQVNSADSVFVPVVDQMQATLQTGIDNAVEPTNLIQQNSGISAILIIGVSVFLGLKILVD